MSKKNLPWSEKKSPLKYDGDKPRMDLLSSAALEGTARVLTFGAKKYASHNWRKGFEWSRIIAALMRHVAEFNDGKDVDAESGLAIVDHIGCCVMFLQEHFHKSLGVDDRYRAEKK